VDEKLAVKMIVATNVFKDFDTGRHFYCHVGVAPFKYYSSSSVRSCSRVSNRVNKGIKMFLHMAAVAAAKRKKAANLGSIISAKSLKEKIKWLH
jgi:hypothetical protein